MVCRRIAHLKLLVSGAPDKWFLRPDLPRLGWLATPAAGNSPDRIAGRRSWALDNGAFSGFDPDRFLQTMDRLADVPRCLFAVCPDVVGDHARTLDLWPKWRAEVVSRGYPVAFVLQDGCHHWSQVPTDANAVFVGGSTCYKLSTEAAEIVRTVRRWGLHAHWGRVNTRRRVRHCVMVGGDSIDGTCCSMFPDIFIPKVHGWIERECRQRLLPI
jgi:hypothetical protein